MGNGPGHVDPQLPTQDDAILSAHPGAAKVRLGAGGAGRDVSVYRCRIFLFFPGRAAGARLCKLRVNKCLHFVVSLLLACASSVLRARLAVGWWIGNCDAKARAARCRARLRCAAARTASIWSVRVVLRRFAAAFLFCRVAACLARPAEIPRQRSKRVPTAKAGFARRLLRAAGCALSATQPARILASCCL